MMEDIPNDHTLILISKNTNFFAIFRNQMYIKFHNIQKCQNIILEARKIKNKNYASKNVLGKENQFSALEILAKEDII